VTSKIAFKPFEYCCPPLGKTYWGKGIATAALRQFLDLAHERPIFAWVAHHNAGSVRVVQKAGFSHDRDDGDQVV
jgi:RimJ/RimL family protein N-acetyltransferase